MKSQLQGGKECRQILFWISFFLPVLLQAASAAGANSNNSIDPYSVLGASHGDPDSAIRKQYHKLCLRYHPDKQVNKSPREKKLLEEKFKTIQSAYSQIATAECRRRYDETQQYSTYTSSNPRRTTTGSYRSQDIFREFHQNYNNHYRSEPFARGFSSNPYYRFGHHPLFTDSSEPSYPGKFIHKETIEIPLATLYHGDSSLQHSVRLGLGRRFMASIRGGAVYSLLYTSLLYALPCLRLFGRTMTLAVWMGLLLAMLPPMPQEIPLNVPIRAGYKPGTKLTFAYKENVVMDIILVIKTIKEKNYKLVGNDLHTCITITPDQASHGCVVGFPRLGSDNRHEAVRVPIAAGTRDRDTFVIPGEGWPVRRKAVLERFGNLVVHIKVQSHDVGRR